MSVSELGSALVTPFDPRRRAPDRRTSRAPPPRPEPEPAAAPPPPARATPFLAPVFRPDLSQLTIVQEPPLPASPVSQPPDPEIYALLDRLVLAIREGDLARARAVVETLETEMLVERSARRGFPSPAPGESVRPASPRAPALSRAIDAVYETLAHYLGADGPTP